MPKRTGAMPNRSNAMPARTRTLPIQHRGGEHPDQDDAQLVQTGSKPDYLGTDPAHRSPLAARSATPGPRSDNARGQISSRLDLSVSERCLRTDRLLIRALPPVRLFFDA